MENDLARSLTLVLFGITLPYHSQTHSKRLFSIHHFHIAHDTPCLTSRSFQSIIFNFSWVNCNSQEKKWTQRLQDRAARVLTNSNYDADTSILLNDLGWQNLETQRQIQKAVVYKTLNYLASDYMSLKFVLRSDLFNSYNLRDSENKVSVPLPRTYYYRNTFCYSGAVLWNNLPTDVRQAKSSTGFRKLLTSSSNTAFMENRL